MDTKELLEQFLEEKHVMQLATSINGQSWICTVYYIHDNQHNLYWASLPTRRHSQELKENNRVAAAIKVKGVKGQPVIGIQIEGTAKEIGTPINDKSKVEAYAAKFKRDQQWIDNFCSGKTEHRFYKLTPTHIQLFDEDHFPEKPQVKLL